VAIEVIAELSEATVRGRESEACSHFLGQRGRRVSTYKRRSSVLTLTLPLNSVSNTLWERASRKLPWVGEGYRIYLQLLGMRIQLDSHFPDSRYQELSEH